MLPLWSRMPVSGRRVTPAGKVEPVVRLHLYPESGLPPKAINVTGSTKLSWVCVSKHPVVSCPAGMDRADTRTFVGTNSNRAVTILAASMTTVQASLPVQAPDQPANRESGFGVAVSITRVAAA